MPGGIVGLAQDPVMLVDAGKLSPGSRGPEPSCTWRAVCNERSNRTRLAQIGESQGSRLRSETGLFRTIRGN